MPKKKTLEDTVEAAIRTEMKDMSKLDPPVRMTLIKLGIQWVMVQHKLEGATEWGAEYGKTTGEENGAE